MLFDSDFIDFINAEIAEEKVEREVYAASPMGRLETSVASTKKAVWESRCLLRTPAHWHQAWKFDSEILSF